MTKKRGEGWPAVSPLEFLLLIVALALTLVGEAQFLEMLVELTTILEPISPREIFGNEQPLEVELGSGDGSFLVEYGKAHPDRNFIGVERLLGRVRRLERKVQREGMNNIAVVRIESGYFLEYLLPRESAEALHIYFPDPWPKRKHRRHRLINEGFPSLAAKALRPGGTVYVRTDDGDYFAQMEAVFAASPLYARVQTPDDLARVLTDFEREFQARGVATQQGAWCLGKKT